MKKILLIFLIVVSAFFHNQVHAANIEIEYNEDIYSMRYIGERQHTGPFGYIHLGDIPAYGIRPTMGFVTDLKIDNSWFNNISKEDLEYFKLVSYYGYNKENNEMAYYMASQELIWRRITGQHVEWLDNTNNEEVINIEPYKNKIIDSINNHYIKPSFDNQEIVGNYNDIIELVDTNNVLKYYDLEHSGINEVWKEDNKLYIKLKTKNSESIKLVKKVKNDIKDTYYADASEYDRDIVVLGLDTEVVSTLKARAQNYNNKIEVTFKDSKSNNLIMEEIKFKIKNLDTNEYYSYNNDNVFESSSGTYLSSFNLEEGKYEIEPISVPKNYYADNTMFEIEYSDNNQAENINCLLDRKQGYVVVNRSFKDNDTIYQIADIKYNLYAARNIIDSDGNIIYLENQLVDTFATDDKGIGKSTILEIGDYYLIEDSDNNYSPYRNRIDISISDKIDSKIIKEEINISTIYDLLHIQIDGANNNQKYGIYANEDIKLGENIVYNENDLIDILEINKDSTEKKLLVPHGIYYIKALDDNTSESYLIDYNENNSSFDIKIIGESNGENQDNNDESNDENQDNKGESNDESQDNNGESNDENQDNKVETNDKEDKVPEIQTPSSDKSQEIVKENISVDNPKKDLISLSNTENATTKLPNTNDKYLKYYLLGIILILIGIVGIFKYKKV